MISSKKPAKIGFCFWSELLIDVRAVPLQDSEGSIKVSRHKDQKSVENKAPLENLKDGTQLSILCRKQLKRNLHEIRGVDPLKPHEFLNC